MDGDIRPLVVLSFVQGLGPVLTRRLLRAFGSAEEILRSSESRLRGVEGVGPQRAAAIRGSVEAAFAKADAELALAAKSGVVLLGLTDPRYPKLLAPLDDAPTILYVRGVLDDALDRYPVAVVGSRDCSAYGIEQAERFGAALGQSGLTVVSGGARGIDSAAHRGAVRLGGRTIAVLGCGLTHAYPKENAELFDRIVAAGGAVVSELPMRTPPAAENFPARNRIIAGLSLGVLVIEAAAKSGSLITAQLAAEDYGREVFALPGRVDSPHSRGTLDLLKQGGAMLVTEPADVIHALEGAAHHAHQGTHAERFPPVERTLPAGVNADPVGESVMAALREPLTADELIDRTEAPPAAVRGQLTLLEIMGRVVREGSRFRLAR
ncbi:MAG: DNA-processing protein DprA [Phycisphaerales bacterium]